MDKLIKTVKVMDKENKRWSKEEPLEGGGYRRIEVEEVSNGFIKTVVTSREGENYEYSCIKSIHEDNPMEEKSLVDKLEEFLKRG